MFVLEQDKVKDADGIDKIIHGIITDKPKSMDIAGIYIHTINKIFSLSDREDFLLIKEGFSFLSFSGSYSQKLIIGVVSPAFQNPSIRNQKHYEELIRYIKKTFCINKEDFNKKCTFFNTEIKQKDVIEEVSFFALSFVSDIVSDLCCSRKY